MGLLDRILGRTERARIERARVAGAAASEALEQGRVDDGLGIARLGLLEAPDDVGLLRVTAKLLLRRGEREGAELFARAADAPDQLTRMVELGSHLLSRDAPELACAFLGRAITFAPFDAVIRSELAIAQVRSGKPAEAVATLALHPCLADDPGALFEFAWASLLTGDVGSAASARAELVRHRAAATLLDKLDRALARARIPAASEPPDARDYLYLEHGSILVECEGAHRGRHAEAVLDARRISTITSGAASLIAERVARPRRVSAVDAAAQPLAGALARSLDGELVPLGSGPLTSGVLVARRAVDLEPLADRLRSPSGEVLTFALVLDWSRGCGAVPDVVGVLARDAQFGPEEPMFAPAAGTDAALADFVRARHAELPPVGRRVASAYVPDAPLPWP